MKIDYISLGNESVTPAQIREFQDAMNAMAAETGWKHKIVVLPPGSKVYTVDDSEPPTVEDILVRQILAADR